MAAYVATPSHEKTYPSAAPTGTSLNIYFPSAIIFGKTQQLPNHTKPSTGKLFRKVQRPGDVLQSLCTLLYHHPLLAKSSRVALVVSS